GVELIGNVDHERIGTVRFDVVGHVPHDLEIHVQQVLAAHPGLSGDARGDDQEIRTSEVFPVDRADHPAIVTIHGGELVDVQRLALDQALHLGNVEENHIAKPFLNCEQSEVAADLPAADETDLLFHFSLWKLLIWPKLLPQSRRSFAANRSPRAHRSGAEGPTHWRPRLGACGTAPVPSLGEGWGSTSFTAPRQPGNERS